MTEKTRRQALGDFGELLVSNSIVCQRCPSGTYELLPPNTPSVDLVCRVCGNVAQVKTLRCKEFAIPRQLLGGAWRPMQILIQENLIPDLFLVLLDSRDSTKVLFLRHELQSETMFVPRNPLSDRAKSPGWTGFIIKLEASMQNFTCLLELQANTGD